MGWSSGGYIFDRVAKAMYLAGFQGEQTIVVLRALIDELEAGDCDTLDESFGISVEADQALIDAGYGEEEDEI